MSIRGSTRVCRRVLKALFTGVLLAVPTSLALADGAATQPAPAAADEAADKPLLMDAFDAIGLKKPMDDLGLKAYGWIQMSYTYNHASPHDRVNQLRVFDRRSNDFDLNQIAFNLERSLKEGKDFDIGGKIEMIYGGDGRYIHSLGAGENISGDADNPDKGDSLNFDPTQFYALVRAPIGNGLNIKVGKYVTPIGYEVIDAPGNALYSRSFLFGYAIPFVHTGVQFDYPVNDQLGMYYGLTFGWDQFNDRNSTLSHMVGGSYKFNDATTLYVNLITGPERDWENTDYRTVVDSTLAWAINDNLTFAINGDFGNESGTGIDGNAGNNWMGAAAYLIITVIPDTLNVNLRAEYMRDETASRLGFTGDLMGLTAGLDIHPIKGFHNLRVRPEIRYDHAFGDDPFDAGPGGGDVEQFTIGVDAIITY